MIISDCVCPSCGSSYLVAESTSSFAGPSHADRVICGERLASWQEPRLKVYRLEMSTKLKYPRIQPSPSPQ
jgi:ribosomal protein S27AE